MLDWRWCVCCSHVFDLCDFNISFIWRWFSHLYLNFLRFVRALYPFALVCLSLFFFVLFFLPSSSMASFVWPFLFLFFLPLYLPGYLSHIPFMSVSVIPLHTFVFFFVSVRPLHSLLVYLSQCRRNCCQSFLGRSSWSTLIGEMANFNKSQKLLKSALTLISSPSITRALPALRRTEYLCILPDIQYICVWYQIKQNPKKERKEKPQN